MGGGVHFDEVEGLILGEGKAGGAFEAGVAILVAGVAHEGFGEEAGDGGFASSAWAGEKIGMGNHFLFQSLLQNSGDMVLAMDLGESLGAIFLIKCHLVIFEWSLVAGKF